MTEKQKELIVRHIMLFAKEYGLKPQADEYVANLFTKKTNTSSNAQRGYASKVGGREEQRQANAPDSSYEVQDKDGRKITYGYKTVRIKKGNVYYGYFIKFGNWNEVGERIPVIGATLLKVAAMWAVQLPEHHFKQIEQNLPI